jgi:hypothetical protein
MKDELTAMVARLVPEQPLPPYTYVPGGARPHPLSDPRGHSFGKENARPRPVTDDNWPECQAYLFGIDLFNAGYFWEAHEVWEGLWHAAGRTGTVADFLKGLIHLAAAGVKMWQGLPAGVTSHARRAAELFERTVQAQKTYYLGLELAELIHAARSWSGLSKENECAGVLRLKN